MEKRESRYSNQMRDKQYKQDREKVQYLDIFTDRNSRGNRAQFIKIRYRGKELRKELSSRIYEGIDVDRLPYFLLEGKVIYLDEVEE